VRLIPHRFHGTDARGVPRCGKSWSVPDSGNAGFDWKLVAIPLPSARISTCHFHGIAAVELTSIAPTYRRLSALLEIKL